MMTEPLFFLLKKIGAIDILSMSLEKKRRLVGLPPLQACARGTFCLNEPGVLGHGDLGAGLILYLIFYLNIN